ncbi:hypothetical protein [Pantoea vagans]|uniref:hypothetical protein n=1 Tax=Pantoea vagans TaxID=470934 RepID=UPI003018C6B3
MEKLNELVELAKKATSGKWIADSGEGWDAIISQQDMVNGNFIVGEFIGPDSKTNKDFVLAASPENILAIAEAFRALEQELEKECDILIDTAESMRQWKQRAEAAEAKLAEQEKRKPDFHVRQIRTEQGPAWIECGADYTRGSHFFTRPVPAVRLAELVPAEWTLAQALRFVDKYTPLSEEEAALFAVNSFRAAILRNIEEEK